MWKTRCSMFHVFPVALLRTLKSLWYNNTEWCEGQKPKSLDSPSFVSTISLPLLCLSFWSSIWKVDTPVAQMRCVHLCVSDSSAWHVGLTGWTLSNKHGATLQALKNARMFACVHYNQIMHPVTLFYRCNLCWRTLTGKGWLSKVQMNSVCKHYIYTMNIFLVGTVISSQLFTLKKKILVLIIAFHQIFIHKQNQFKQIPIIRISILNQDINQLEGFLRHKWSSFLIWSSAGFIP